jgi:hypothetical protein
MLLPGKDAYKQLIMINNELCKSSLGFPDITIPQQKWARNEGEKINDGSVLWADAKKRLRQSQECPYHRKSVLTTRMPSGLSLHHEFVSH